MCSKFMSTTVLIIYNHNNTKNNGNTNESNKNKVGINMKHLIYWFRKKVIGIHVGLNPGRKIKSPLSYPLHQGILA